jgi:hypothetical protein
MFDKVSGVSYVRGVRLARPLAVAALLLAGAGGLAPAQATDSPAYFPQTRHTVGGAFLDYWKSHGGLARQGYPITEEFGERSLVDGKTYTVQYFERAVFELHPENQPPYNVLLTPLGADALKAHYADGTPPGQTVNKATANQYFAQTGHVVGGGFWQYWQRNGGLAKFGLPLTDEFSEISAVDGKPYTVQYFERAVFEYHPEAPPAFGVQLSLLGAIHYKGRYEHLARITPDNWPPAPGLAPPTRAVLFGTTFDTPDLRAWKARPDPNVEDAPTWTVVNGHLQQAGDAMGEVTADETVYLTGDPTWRNYTLEAQVSCVTGTAVGVVWRASEKGCYRFDLTMALPHTNPKATLWRFDPATNLPVRIAGVPPEKFGGYEQGKWYTIRVTTQGSRQQVWINDVPVLDVQDSTLTAGQVGLLATADRGAAFDNVRVSAAP